MSRIPQKTFSGKVRGNQKYGEEKAHGFCSKYVLCLLSSVFFGLYASQLPTICIKILCPYFGDVWHAVEGGTAILQKYNLVILVVFDHDHSAIRLFLNVFLYQRKLFQSPQMGM